MALPTLTPEQRADALAKAAEARKARSELLASIKSGTTSIEKVREAIEKTHCLRADGEIGDPRGRSVDGLSELARQIQGLIGQKLDDLGVSRVDGAAQHGSSIRSPRRSIEVSTSAPTGRPRLRAEHP